MRLTLIIVLAFLILPIVAFAAGQDAGATAVSASSDGGGVPVVTDWNEWVRDSALGKMVAAVLLSAVTLGITKLRGSVTDRQGTASVLFLSLVAGIVSSAIAGTPFDPKLVEAIVGVAVLAIGGYTTVKKIGWPDDVPVGAHVDVPSVAGEIEARA